MQAVFQRPDIWRKEVGDWIVAPKDIQVWIPENCECYFAEETFDVIMLRNLRWENYPGFSGCALSEIARVFLGGWQMRLDCRREDNVKMEQRLEWCGHKPRNTSSHQKLKETKNRISPGASAERNSPADTLIYATKDLFWTSGFQNYKRITLYISSH